MTSGKWRAFCLSLNMLIKEIFKKYFVLAWIIMVAAGALTLIWCQVICRHYDDPIGIYQFSTNSKPEGFVLNSFI